jgi:glycerate 2-kinase
MNILIACDSFKDALDAASVCRAIERGLRLADPSVSTRIFPLADGGEGMSDILNSHLNLKDISIEVHDPLFRKINATYHITADGKTAFIEMAQAAGLQLLTFDERNPLKTTTFGVGEMIHDAASRGATYIVLGIGGSATNDVGIGMAAALGWQFLDKNEEVLLPIGENLAKIHTMIPPQYSSIFDLDFEVICDVTNPLLGKTGAAYVYARQKGATDDMIESLEKGAENFINIALNYLSKNVDNQSIKNKNNEIVKNNFPELAGAGAAGGLGFGALFFLNATLKRGIDALMDVTNFDAAATWADVIVTGEGRLDSQTADGKLIAGIIARSQQKRVIALCGALEGTPQYLSDLGVYAAFSIAQKPCTLPEALAETAENLEKTAFNVGRLLLK